MADHRDDPFVNQRARREPRGLRVAPIVAPYQLHRPVGVLHRQNDAANEFVGMRGEIRAYPELGAAALRDTVEQRRIDRVGALMRQSSATAFVLGGIVNNK